MLYIFRNIYSYISHVTFQNCYGSERQKKSFSIDLLIVFVLTFKFIVASVLNLSNFTFRQFTGETKICILFTFVKKTQADSCHYKTETIY